MEKRENYKDIELGGRNWRICKFDARTGSYMIFKLLGILSPAFKSLDLNKIKGQKPEDFDFNSLNLTEALSGITNLPEEEFFYIQNKCLKVCFEMLPAGMTCVLNENGSFGVLEVEDDTMLVLGLMTHALMFNGQSFFPGSLFNSLIGGASTTSPQN
jgi:hypothetical protein